MSIAQKIGFSIGGLMVLLVIMIIVSLVAMEGASDGFIQYRGFAKDSNLTGRIEAHLLQARLSVKNYIKSGHDQDLKKFKEDWQKMESLLSEATAEIQKPERAALIADVIDAEKNYKTTFQQVKELIDQRNEKVYKVLDVVGPIMREQLTEIMVSAKKDNDMSAAFHAGIAAQHLLIGRLNAAKFLVNNQNASYSERSKSSRPSPIYSVNWTKSFKTRSAEVCSTMSKKS